MATQAEGTSTSPRVKRAAKAALALTVVTALATLALSLIANVTRTRIERNEQAWITQRLDALVPGYDYSYYVMLHGAVQHTLYHAGQIAILKKEIGK